MFLTSLVKLMNQRDLHLDIVVHGYVYLGSIISIDLKSLDKYKKRGEVTYQ